MMSLQQKLEGIILQPPDSSDRFDPASARPESESPKNQHDSTSSRFTMINQSSYDYIRTPLGYFDCHTNIGQSLR
jgi:hypothetical protein